MKKINVAIDGPAAGGKTTVARLLATKLGLIYVDTGMMYRAVSWQALQDNCNLDDAESLGKLAEGLDLRLEADAGSGCRVYVSSKDLTDLLHEPEINVVVPKVAAVSLVRRDMVRRQRELADQGGIVMAGRDICTVVLPDARLKYYLDASLEERTRRRVKDLESSGHKVTFEEVKEQLAKRDYDDSHRSDSPLIQAPDAKYIDSDNLSALEIVEIMIQDYQQALSEV
ncbi:(d)CMP kinase [bacterium]|nr:(d)CMP kinase [bacterium]